MSKNIIKIAKIIAPIVSSRDLINDLKKDIKRFRTNSISLDFNKVEFLSRSAAHALLSIKESFQKKPEIYFINTNNNVKEMLRLVAANRALPKEEKINFKADLVDINCL